MRYRFTALFLLLFAFSAIRCQEVNYPPRHEIGFDLLPIIVTGSTNNNVGLGMELFYTQQLKEGKLRLRYLTNRRGANYLDNGILRRYEKMLSDNSLRTVENRYWQRQNHGLRLGYEQVFRTKVIEYYWSFDLFGQYNRAQIASLALLDNPNLPDSEPEEEFSAVNDFNSYEFGIIPTLGLGFYIDEKIQIRVEIGPKLSVLHEDLPLLNENNELFYSSYTISSSELFLLNDILITYKF
ncbi:hypothetical protein [Lewinella sp. LCG006]|uniref:hypothetical protein n=1 Tax=Lewinella sp. LCG006 TaxID=3231911 RepID=UPI003460E5A9